MFGCTPAEAERIDPRHVTEIAEYRMAKQAIAVFNQGRKGIEQMGSNPALGQILADMLEAQQGETASLDTVVGLMAARPEPDEDES